MSYYQALVLIEEYNWSFRDHAPKYFCLRQVPAQQPSCWTGTYDPQVSWSVVFDSWLRAWLGVNDSRVFDLGEFSQVAVDPAQPPEPTYRLVVAAVRAKFKRLRELKSPSDDPAVLFIQPLSQLRYWAEVKGLDQYVREISRRLRVFGRVF